jgi:hypothetical protein
MWSTDCLITDDHVGTSVAHSCTSLTDVRGWPGRDAPAVDGNALWTCDVRGLRAAS